MRIVDLSLPIDERMPGVGRESSHRIESEGWNASMLSLYSHSGTHMDAPFHFLPDGDTIDQLDLNALVGPAHVVDLAPAEPRQSLSVADLSSVGEQMRPGARLLLRTDWHQRYGTSAYRDELPRISLELAEWLVARRVALVGVEPPSVADVNNRDELTAVHQTLFRGGVVIVEGLANLDRLTQPVVQFIALPLNVSGGDGTPVRAVAVDEPPDAASQTNR